MKKNRQPWRITLDTNPDDCNMHCIMCEDHSAYSPTQENRRKAEKPPRRMPIQMVRRVFREAKELGIREVIPSTMGEPLLYREFEEILSLCEKFSMTLNLTTNGSFPRLGATKWAEKIVPITSDVKISWNAATSQTDQKVMVGSQWENRLNSIQEFIAVRDRHFQTSGYYCRVTLQMTFLEQNLAEIEGIIRLAVSLGIDRLKGHHLWAHFPEIQDFSLRRSSNSIARWNQMVEKANQLVEQLPLPNGKKLLLENFFPLKENKIEDIAPDGECPFLGEEIWISAEGRFNPCCAPDQERRKLGEFGNVQEQSLEEIWDGERYQILMKHYQSHGLCQSCNMRKPKEAL